jgi:hypothetical protein
VSFEFKGIKLSLQLKKNFSGGGPQERIFLGKRYTKGFMN